MSGGAGAYGAGGGGGAGVIVPAITPAARPTPPWALKLDPRTRDFLTDANGRYISVHPVDHEAMMRLLPAAGTVAEAPAQGGPWRLLQIDDAAAMTLRLREYVEACWRPLIARGDLKIVNVTAEPANSIGRARVRIEWMNLRDPEDQNRTTSI